MKSANMADFFLQLNHQTNGGVLFLLFWECD